MILAVRFEFPLSVIPPGRRAPSARVGVSHVHVEIPEPTPDEAPQALAYPWRGGMRRILHHRGALLGPPAGPRLDAAALAILAGSPPAEGDPFGRRVPKGTIPDVVHDPAAGGRIVATGEHDEAARIRIAASLMAMAGGVLHVPVPEPGYVLDDRRDPPVALITEGPGAEPGLSYGAGEADFLSVSLGARIPEAIEVLRPEALSIDAPARAVVRAAQVVRGRLSACAGTDGPADRARAALAELLAPASAPPDPGALAAVLRDVLDVLDGPAILDRVTARRAEIAVERLSRADLGDLCLGWGAPGQEPPAPGRA